jgi:uncharacterized protein YndB with AHSA1/START domain
MAISKMAPRRHDVAVLTRTGKTWAEWQAILDQAGASKLDHKAIVAILNQYGVGPWWEQMVAVNYEQARGLREVHEKAGGSYEITVSRTLGVPVSALYDAWNDPQKRRRWLKDAEFETRISALNKRLRITWVDGKTHVVVAFTANGDSKSKVSVEHIKLANSKAAASMKIYWAEQLKNLQDYLKG